MFILQGFDYKYLYRPSRTFFMKSLKVLHYNAKLSRALLNNKDKNMIDFLFLIGK